MQPNVKFTSEEMLLTRQSTKCPRSETLVSGRYRLNAAAHDQVRHWQGNDSSDLAQRLLRRGATTGYATEELRVGGIPKRM